MTTQNHFSGFTNCVFAVLVVIFVTANTYITARAGNVEKVGDVTSAISSFKEKVEQFRIFFSRMPKALSEQPFSSSPTGSVFSFYKYKMVDLSYDVQKTDSLISPFVGYIYLTYETWDNKRCGDISQEYKGLKETVYYGFSSATKAKNSDNEECYHHSLLTAKVLSPPEKVKFTFAYQESRWVFKGVIRVAYNRPAIILSTALGYPVEPARYREENKFWEVLVK